MSTVEFVFVKLRWHNNHPRPLQLTSHPVLSISPHIPSSPAHRTPRPPQLTSHPRAHQLTSHLAFTSPPHIPVHSSSTHRTIYSPIFDIVGLNAHERCILSHLMGQKGQIWLFKYKLACISRILNLVELYRQRSIGSIWKYVCFSFDIINCQWYGGANCP